MGSLGRVQVASPLDEEEFAVGSGQINRVRGERGSELKRPPGPGHIGQVLLLVISCFHGPYWCQ